MPASADVALAEEPAMHSTLLRSRISVRLARKLQVYPLPRRAAKPLMSRMAAGQGCKSSLFVVFRRICHCLQ
jgi:hypothetical protein